MGKDIICLEEDEDRTVEKENTEITEIIVENVVVVVKEITEEKKSIMMIDTNIVNLKEVENDLQEMTPEDNVTWKRIVSENDQDIKYFSFLNFCLWLILSATKSCIFCLLIESSCVITYQFWKMLECI